MDVGRVLPYIVIVGDGETIVTRIIGWLACAGAVLLLVVAMVTGTAPAQAATDAARVTGAWVRLAAVPGRPAAGYFTLRAGTRPVELVAVGSPLARVELHAMSMAGGVMKMDTLPSVRVAGGAQTSFTPGAAHLMLFDLPATVTPGATVPLTFRFADGTSLRVDAAARAAGADAPMSTAHGAN